jgi:hypothetical protein
LLYVPLLYGAGWLLSRPLALLAPGWRPDQVDLAGIEPVSLPGHRVETAERDWHAGHLQDELGRR